MKSRAAVLVSLAAAAQSQPSSCTACSWHNTSHLQELIASGEVQNPKNLPLDAYFAEVMPLPSTAGMDLAGPIPRAQEWVTEKVPYCQCNSDCCNAAGTQVKTPGGCKYCGTFRCDCSGYASWVLGFPAGT